MNGGFEKDNVDKTLHCRHVLPHFKAHKTAQTSSKSVPSILRCDALLSKLDRQCRQKCPVSREVRSNFRCSLPRFHAEKHNFLRA